MDDINGLGRLDERVADLESSLTGAQNMASAFNAELTTFKTTMAATSREVKTLESGISRGLKRAIDGLVFDGDTLADALKGVGTSMLDAAYNAAVRPVSKHFGNVLGTGLEGLIQSVLPFERGGAFASGRVTPFAQGGIVTQATAFPMRGGTGLMGEAGPEAIMPLTRTAGGKLGVRTEGGGAPIHVTMNISTPDVAGFDRSQSQIAAKMSRLMARGARNR